MIRGVETLLPIMSLGGDMRGVYWLTAGKIEYYCLVILFISKYIATYSYNQAYYYVYLLSGVIQGAIYGGVGDVD